MKVKIERLYNPNNLYIIKFKNIDNKIPLYKIECLKDFINFLEEKEEDIINRRIKIGYILNEYNFLYSFLAIEIFKHNRYTFISQRSNKNKNKNKNIIIQTEDIEYPLGCIFYIKNNQIIKEI